MPPTERQSFPIGHALALLSLSWCAAFWLQMALFFMTKIILIPFNVIQWYVSMGVALVLAIAAAVLRSRLWRVAVPVSALMFLFIGYVIGT